MHNPSRRAPESCVHASPLPSCSKQTTGWRQKLLKQAEHAGAGAPARWRRGWGGSRLAAAEPAGACSWRGGGNLDPAPLGSRYHHMIGELRFPAAVRDRGPTPAGPVHCTPPCSALTCRLTAQSPQREHPGTWTSLLFTIGCLGGACPAGRLTSDWLGFMLQGGSGFETWRRLVTGTGDRKATCNNDIPVK